MSFLINPFAFAVAGGDFESIATVTVGSGGAANIEFTSIPATYQHLQVRMIGRSLQGASSTDAVRVVLNSDTGSNYAEHYLRGTGAAAQAGASTSQTSTAVNQFAGDNATASVFGAVVLDILDYASTSKYKTVRSSGGIDNNGSGLVYVSSGLWMSTSAVMTIKLTAASTQNFVQYTTAALYGIKAP